MNVETG